MEAVELNKQRRHILYDLWVPMESNLLRTVNPWPGLLGGAAKAVGFTILDTRFHQFEPHGVTGILLLAESHISIHTWPEEQLATLDIFTCGSHDLNAFISQIRPAINPIHEQITEIQRGIRADAS